MPKIACSRVGAHGRVARGRGEPSQASEGVRERVNAQRGLFEGVGRGGKEALEGEGLI